MIGGLRSAAGALAVTTALAACEGLQSHRSGTAADDSSSELAVDSTPVQPTSRRRIRRTIPQVPRPDADTSATTPDTAPPSQPPGPADLMMEDLHHLVRAQGQYFANVGSYARRFQQLGIQYLPHAGVHLAVLAASDEGWTGQATFDGWPGRSCVVAVGRVADRPATAAGKRLPANDGRPVCDSPPPGR
jgi:hypothetical protein